MIAIFQWFWCGLWRHCKRKNFSNKFSILFYFIWISRKGGWNWSRNALNYWLNAFINIFNTLGTIAFPQYPFHGPTFWSKMEMYWYNILSWIHSFEYYLPILLLFNVVLLLGPKLELLLIFKLPGPVFWLLCLWLLFTLPLPQLLPLLVVDWWFRLFPDGWFLLVEWAKSGWSVDNVIEFGSLFGKRSVSVV